MQPYLFPYIGYFQLIRAADKFVVHDDVQYIKGGWIHRNRIQINDKYYLFTFSLKKDSSLKNINTRLFSNQFNKEKVHFLRIIQNTYKKAPYFVQVNELLHDIFDYKSLKIAAFITNSLNLICGYLEIKTPIYLSSELNKNNDLKGQDRVINICKTLNATIYLNPIGGKLLYSKAIFKKNKVSLFFLQTKDIHYEIINRLTLRNLSILDIMMFNSVNTIKGMLDNYELI